MTQLISKYLVFSAIFNNISAMSLGKVLLVPPMVEETGGFGGKPKKLEQQTHTKPRGLT
jgi:hypothetical protein